MRDSDRWEAIGREAHNNGEARTGMPTADAMLKMKDAFAGTRNWMAWLRGWDSESTKAPK